MPVEFSPGYIERTRETLEGLDNSLTPETRAVAKGLKAHFQKSAPPVEAGGVERDYPAEFEAWWAGYKHRNRETADYWLKKQIAFDAFYFGARPTPAPAGLVSDEVREAVNFMRLRFHKTRLTSDVTVAAKDLSAVLNHFAALTAAKEQGADQHG